MIDTQDRFDTPGIHVEIGYSNQRFIRFFALFWGMVLSLSIQSTMQFQPLRKARGESRKTEKKNGMQYKSDKRRCFAPCPEHLKKAGAICPETRGRNLGKTVSVTNLFIRNRDWDLKVLQFVQFVMYSWCAKQISSAGVTWTDGILMCY